MTAGTPDAHGVRLVWTLIHLTEFAPGCEGLALGDRRRWIHRLDADPRHALRAALARLGRSAREVVARAMKLGDVGLFAADDPGGWPLAFVIDGFAEGDVARGLMDIATRDAAQQAQRSAA